MTRVSVLWFDPGGTTGCALCTIGIRSLLDGDIFARMKIHKAWEISGPEDRQTDAMMAAVGQYGRSAVGVESFTLSKFLRDPNLLAPVRLRAKLEYGIHMMGLDTRLFFQSFREADSTLTDDRQRRNDLWIPGADHRRVAVKHCATFFLKAQQKPQLRYAAWPHINWTEEVQA